MRRKMVIPSESFLSLAAQQTLLVLGVNPFGGATGGESVNRVATDRASSRRRRIHQEKEIGHLVRQNRVNAIPFVIPSLARYERNSSTSIEGKLAIDGWNRGLRFPARSNYYITRSNPIRSPNVRASHSPSLFTGEWKSEWNGEGRGDKAGEINNTDWSSWSKVRRWIETRSLGNDNCPLLCQNVEMVYTAVALRTLRLADVTSPPRGGSLANERFAPAPAALQSL